MRTPLVAGNWKMNGDRDMARALSQDIVAGSTGFTGVDILLCPPYTLLETVQNTLTTSQCKCGAQDMDVNESGAFTGQISAAMLIDCDCDFVILGHSERRTLFGETDSMVAEKAKVAVSGGLTAILCVGETLEERETEITDQVIARQLSKVLDVVGIESFKNIVVAYEPVWAIGTGLTATPEQAQDVHNKIREQLAQHDLAVASECKILYGGSMKPDNASELLAKPDIDGGLIGGASLKADDFLAICQAAQIS